MPGNSTSADSRRERGGAQARAMADIDQVLAGALAAGTHKVPTGKLLSPPCRRAAASFAAASDTEEEQDKFCQRFTQRKNAGNDCFR